MENHNNFDPNDQHNNKEDDTEDILESEINEDDYQFTEKGFDPEKK